MEQLLSIMEMLRDKQFGCPWDKQQNFRSIAPHTLEEVYEVIDAIENHGAAELKNELGDLLFQIVFYAQLGKEQGLFDFSDIINEITNKLLTRHPHVFPDATIESFGSKVAITSGQVEQNWEQIKAEERVSKLGNKTETALPSVLDDVPQALPGILRARKLQKRAANEGFDWPDTDSVLEKVDEELAELKQAIASGKQAQIEDELGDMFFTLVNLSRHLQVNPESCLRAANNKFETRYKLMEKMLSEAGIETASLSIEELEHFWQKVKFSLQSSS